MTEVHHLPDDDAALSTPEGGLAAMLASRICHDLTSPLGAIANGVELLILSGAEPTPEMDLISESVDSANARLRFFRLAYGTAGHQPVGRAEVVRTLAGLARGSRYVYDWTAAGDPPRAEVKAVFLLLQCLEVALPLGGQLRIAQDSESWTVTAQGPRLRTDLPAWEAVRSPAPLLADSASQVQFTLLAGALAGLGRALALTQEPDRIEARF